jgi:hypothetical protein
LLAVKEGRQSKVMEQGKRQTGWEQNVRFWSRFCKNYLAATWYCIPKAR